MPHSHPTTPIRRTPFAPGKPAGKRAGFTLIELVVVATVLLTALSIFSQTMIAVSKQRTINRENAVAAEVIRRTLELMRNEDFRDIYYLYNERSDDDPGGAGTAPGNRFAVEGLDPLPGAVGGLVGEVVFPTMEGLPGAGPLGGAGGPIELREDLIDPSLGMPRDLNGNSIIEPSDRAEDYIILPIRIQVDWLGPFGPRHMETLTMLAEFRS